MRLARMIIDGAQRPHAAIRNIRTMLLRDLVVLGNDLARIVAQILQKGYRANP